MKAIDLTGKRFNRLTVLFRNGTHVSPSGQKSPMWECQCDCGKRAVIRYSSLAYGGAGSCGCLILEKLKDGLRTTHGLSRRHSKVPEYGVWVGIRDRCENPKNSHFYLYGGSGISVCERWQDFGCFYSDMGPRPSDRHSIDRIKGTIGYEPGNCRWATAKEQANNQSSNRRITYGGETLTLAQWSERLGLPYHTLKKRTGRLGWTPDRALTEPIQVGRRRVANLL